jgi:hypothetical protein
MPQTNMVDFSIAKDGVTVSASVPSEFFEKNVLPVIKHLVGGMLPPREPAAGAEPEDQGAGGGGRDFSVKMIVQHMGKNTALDILTAAAICLTLVHGRSHFSWRELLTEADTAPSYWTKARANGAENVLAVLKSRGILVEASNGNLSLGPATEAGAIEMLAKMSAEAGYHPAFTRRRGSAYAALAVQD